MPNVTLREEFTNLAFNGCKFNKRERFEGHEQLPKERDEGPHKDFKQNVVLMERYESED